MQGYLLTGASREKKKSEKTEIELLKERNEALQQSLYLFYGKVSKLTREIKRLEGRKK